MNSLIVSKPKLSYSRWLSALVASRYAGIWAAIKAGDPDLDQRRTNAASLLLRRDPHEVQVPVRFVRMHARDISIACAGPIQVGRRQHADRPLEVCES